MEEISTRQARDEFAGVINRVAYAHERFTLTRRGKPVAVILSVEDYADLKAAVDALADPANAKPIPWEDVKARLGL